MLYDADYVEGVTGHYGVYGQYVFGDDICIPDDHLDEEWDYCPDNSNYMVSTHGRVYSLKTNSFIKPKKMDKQGHVGISAYIGVEKGKAKNKYLYIHRQMAKAFLDNINNLPVVRHLNDVPDDNVLDNLAWGTQKDNMRDCELNGNAYKLTDEDREKGFEKVRRPVVATNLKTGERTKYRSINDAVRALHVQQANLCKVLSGERKHTGGYSFERCDE